MVDGVYAGTVHAIAPSYDHMLTPYRRICVLHGRPVSIPRAEVDVDLPQDLPELRVAPQTHALPNMLAMIRLTEALENAKEAM